MPLHRLPVVPRDLEKALQAGSDNTKHWQNIGDFGEMDTFEGDALLQTEGRNRPQRLGLGRVWCVRRRFRESGALVVIWSRSAIRVTFGQF